MEILNFEGRMQPDDFLDWMSIVDQMFEYYNPLDHKKIKLVTIKLRKQASFWWENLRTQREKEG